MYAKRDDQIARPRRAQACERSELRAKRAMRMCPRSEQIFFLFFILHQLPFPILLWGLASGGRSVRWRCAALPFLGKPILGGRRRTLFSPFVSFLGASARDAERSLGKISTFFRRGGISAFSGYLPRFLEGIYGC